MKPDPRATQTPKPSDDRETRDKDPRSSGSFLVRAWLEQREIDGEEPSFRGYIKNLATGEERFVRLPGDLGAEIARSVTGAADDESSD